MLILINKKSNGSVQTNWAIIEDIADIRYIVLHRCKINPLLRVLCHVFPNVTCFEGHEYAIAQGRFDFERHHAGHINYD